jgi:predicted amidohydrolase
MKTTVALAQIDSRVGDLDRNLDHHIAFIERSIKKHADIVIFPELSLTGYTLRDIVWDIAIDPRVDPRFKKLLRLSKSISIAVGIVEMGSDHGVYNSVVFLEDGEIKYIHRKIYLPTYGMFEESRYFSPGRSLRAFDTKYGRFGILICEDLWHCSLPYLLAQDGAEAIIVPTASPTRLNAEKTPTGVEMNHEHLRVYARLLSLYMVFCNRTGFEDGVNFWGGSSIVDPMGTQLVTAASSTEELVIASLSSMEIRRARRASRHFIDEDTLRTSQWLKEIVERRAGDKNASEMEYR